MRNFLALFGTLLLGVSSAQAEDVTSTYLSNADFSQGTAITTGVCTYAGDVSKNSANGSSLMDVDSWTAGATGDAKAGGLFAYGSSAWCGKNNSAYYVPTTDPEGNTSGNALGIVGVWKGEAYYTQDAKTPLPAGKYTITFKIYNTVGTSNIVTNLFGFKEEDGTTHYGSTKTFTVGAWQEEVVSFELTEETSGTFSVGYVSDNVGSGSDAARVLFIDNVKVEYDASASAEEKAELATAIAAAEAHTLGFGVGEYAPYNNVAALQTLASAREAATSAEVAAAISALSEATWTANTEELDAIYDGSLSQKTVSVNSGEANAEMVNGGWTSAVGYRLILGDTETYPALSQTTAGRAVFVWNGTAVKYGETTGYTMPLEANTVYELSLKHCGWNAGINGVGVSVLNSDNEGLQSVTTAAAASAVTTAGAFVSSTYYFETGSASDYILSVAPNSGNATLADFSLVKAQAGTVTVTEDAANTDKTAYYATCATTTPVNMDECGFTAYALTVDGTSVSYAPIAGTVPAGTPLLVSAESAGDYEAVLGLTANAESVTTALLVSDGTVQGDGETIYTLYKENGQLGWYLFTTESTIPAGKCYLQINASGAKFIGFDGAADAIGGIAKSQSAPAARYNLGGQRVDGSYKGIVIENGKKYLNK